MRLKITKSKNAESFYMIRSTYINGINTSHIVEKLGTLPEVIKKANGQDPYEWAKNYVALQTQKEKEETRKIEIAYSPTKPIEKGQQRLFNGGYLFLQKIYHELKLDKLAASISKKHKFTYDLNSILANLIYTRMLFPASKLASCELSKRFLESGNFELQHVYRALSVIAEEADLIQAQIYKNSLSVSKRNTGIVYYDCTNYFFETEQEQNLKQYGVSKEHKPNPIVQMGLFMDSDGIPLAFNINPGNTNEQTTLKPLEQKLLEDFHLSKLVVCTDAGLSSTENRNFNNTNTRAFITTQSIKKLKTYLQDWCLDPKGWHILGSQTSKKLYDIDTLNEDAPSVKNRVFYKERWINENGLEQKLIVTYCIKYKHYMQTIRARQIERAAAAIESGMAARKKASSSPQRFIKEQNITTDGEIAKKRICALDEEKIANESRFDGFYAVCTSLNENAAAIANVNHRRWEIEECFRIMKSEFKARPVFLQKDERIKAHFMTCFIALIIYRYLEKRLDERFTCEELLQTLKEMNFLEAKGEGYIPAYTRTDLTDALHEKFNFKTDIEILTRAQIKKILQASKKQ